MQALLAELTIKLVTKEAEQADSMQRLKDKDREIEQMQQQCTKSKGELSAGGFSIACLIYCAVC